MQYTRMNESSVGILSNCTLPFDINFSSLSIWSWSNYSGKFHDAGISNLNDLLLAITDVNLTVSFGRRAIVVSVHSEDSVFSAVEGINKLGSIDNSSTKVDNVVLNQVNGGC